MSWEKVVLRCEEEYGTHTDWDEEFFIYPECGEPIYKDDWNEDALHVCPVCGFEWC